MAKKSKETKKVYCSGCGSKQKETDEKLWFCKDECKKKAKGTGELFCPICGSKNPDTGEIEAKRKIPFLGQKGSICCNLCLPRIVEHPYVRFLRSKIKKAWSNDTIKGELGVEENYYRQKGRELDRIALNRTILREIVQNADDAMRKRLEKEDFTPILVARFSEKHIEVANNGRHFEPYDEKGNIGGDFKKILDISGEMKRFDPFSTGYHGNGFQIVFAITNHPEIYSNGNGFRLDPTKDYGDEGAVLSVIGDKSKDFPYGAEGVLFRFTWRDDHWAEEHEYPGKNPHPFSDKDDWYRWDEDERKNIFDDWRNYLHDVILCCNYLRKIRVTWEEGGICKSYQVERDFGMSWPLEVGKGNRVVSITEGFGHVKENGYGPNDWTWTNENGKPAEPEVYGYFWASTHIKNKNGYVFFIKKGKEKEHIKTFKEIPKDLLSYHITQRNDIHILFPMFPKERRYRDSSDATSFVYSVLPLPKHGGNFFIASAHLFINEDRSGIWVDSKKGVLYKYAVLNLARLYQESWKEFVRTIKNGKLPKKYKNKIKLQDENIWRILLDNLPAQGLYEWFGPEQEEFQVINRALWKGIREVDFVRFGGGWVAPNKWVLPTEGIDRMTQRILLSGMEVPHPSEEDEEHGRYPQLVDGLENKVLAPRFFKDQWGRFRRQNWDKEHLLIHEKEGGCIKGEFIKALIDYCYHSDNIDELGDLEQLIPNQLGQMRNRNHLRTPPHNDVRLIKLIPKNRRIHEDFESALSKIGVEDKAELKELLEGLEEGKEELERGDIDNEESPIIALYDYISGIDLKKNEKDQRFRIGSYHLVLADDKLLYAPNEVSYSPKEFFQDTKRLFKEVGVEIRWVHDIFLNEDYNEIISKFGIERPDYVELLSSRDWDGTKEKKRLEQKLIFEGLISSVNPKELSDLPFIPCKGNMISPNKSFTRVDKGLDTPDIRSFLGVMDDHLFKFAEELENESNLNIVKSNGKLEQAGMVVIQTTDSILERIDKIVDECPKRFKCIEPDSKDHKTTSEIVHWYCNRPNWDRQHKGKYKFVPARYKGGIVLCPIPGFTRDEIKGGSINKYERDWLFAPIRKDIIGMTKELKDRIHILELAKGYDLKKVDGILKPAMLESDGNPRVYSVLFLSNLKEEGSLFLKDVLCKRLCIDKNDEEEIHRQRLSMLETLKRWMKGSKIEGKREWERSSDIPCLYDPDGQWHPPKCFALDISRVFNIFEKIPLHPELINSRNPRFIDATTLNALGVSPVPNKDSVISKTKELVQRRDRERLLEIARYILLKNSEIGLAKEDLSFEWVPTGNEELLLSPNEVLLDLGIKDISKSLGEGYQKILRFENKTLRKKEHVDTIRKNASNLGFRLQIDLEKDLIPVIKDHAERNMDPPEKLLDSISELIRRRQMDSGPVNLESLLPLPYFCLSQGWVHEPERIVLSEGGKVPEPLHEHFIFLQNDDIKGHEPYLSAIGARSDLSSSDILKWMRNNRTKINYQVWEWLFTFQDDLVKIEGFEEERIFVPEGMDEVAFAPKMVLFLDSEAIETEIFGKYVIITGSENKETWKDRRNKLLLALGARELYDLDEHEVLDLLDEIRIESETTMEKRDDCFLIAEELLLHLLSNDIDVPNGINVPATMGDEYVWETIDNCYYDDLPQVWKYFKDELPGLEYRKGDEQWMKWLIRHEARSVKINSQKRFSEDDFEGELEEDRSYQDIRFKQLASAISDYLKEETGRDYSERFQWLKEMRILRCTRLRLKYELGDIEKDIPDRYYYDGDKSKLYVVYYASSSMFEDLAKDIFRTSLGDEKFPEKGINPSVITHKIQFMLSEDLDKWWFQVPGYDPPPLKQVPTGLIEVIEVDDDDRYHEMRRQFREELYQYCQICKTQTPFDEYGNVCERMRPIISRHGGLYYGDATTTNIGNYLWLCPTCYTLYERRFVKIGILENTEDRDKRVEKLNNYIESLANVNQENKVRLFDLFTMDVPIRHYDDEGIKERGKEGIFFQRKHLTMVLENLINYVSEEEWD